MVNSPERSYSKLEPAARGLRFFGSGGRFALNRSEICTVAVRLRLCGVYRLFDLFAENNNGGH